MAISPSINPQAIVGNRPKSIQSFQKFISGDSPLGSSVVSSAANNIVGFQRASVRPAAPDINSIVSTISSNILNQVNNSIKNATNIINRSTDAKIQSSQNQILTVVEKIKPEQNNQVTQLQTVVKNIQNQTTNVVEKISEDYKKRINAIDSAKPNNLLSNFIDLYKTALDFVRFFGDRRNIDSLRDNLVSLRESFTESFEVAKLIRNTILKIFSQLSSLPKAGPGSSSGLNIDVNVPGGGPRKALPRGVSPGKMRGKLGMLGLGLGGAAMGGAAINALGNSRDQAQSIQQDTSIPGQLIDTFGYLISRFANAVDEMIHGGEKSQSQSQGSSGSSGSESSIKGKGSSGGGGGVPGKSGNVNAGDIIADTAEEKAFIATVREREGTAGPQGYSTFFGGSQYGGDLTNKTVSEVVKIQKKFLAEGRGDYPGGRSAAVGAGQFMEPENVVRAMGMDPDKVKFTPELQNQMILYLAKKKRGVDVSKPLTIEGIRKLNLEWSGFGSYYGQNKNTPQGTLDIYNQNLKEAKKSVKPGVGGENTPDWVLPPQKREELKLREKTISQPPPSQTELPKITTLPLDLSGGTGGGQQSAAGQIPAPTRSGAPGPQIPYIPSSNPENFLVLYSKIVYNIVDA